MMQGRAVPAIPPVHYQLDAFPPRDLDWRRLAPLVGRANAAVGNYNGLIKALPNPEVLLSPLVTNEAVLSSRIEGTAVTLTEALAIEADPGASGITEEQRNDAEEVLNYRRALWHAASVIPERPLSQHVLRELHQLLMQGVRGHAKRPGAFRERQNWIGPPNGSLEEASFVPIPQEHLVEGMDRWIQYVQDRDHQDDLLVRLAIIHAEFEALHPFADGNGRLGRMIIPLFMYERGLLNKPSFFISGYLEARRDQYVDSLRAVSRAGAWTEWCCFFLEAVIAQAKENREKAEAMLALYQEMTEKVPKITRSQYSSKAVDFLFSYPIFTGVQFRKQSGISRTNCFQYTQPVA